MDKNSIIFVAGHNGFVGNSLYNRLISDGYTNVNIADRHEVDFLDSAMVEKYFDNLKPEIVFGCVAKVGGIKANMLDPYSFLFNNLVIQNNLISQCVKHNSKLVFLGSSCIYPKDYIQPLKEEYLLNAPLESTNEGYSLAKISGLKLCEYANQQFGTEFVSLMPCNLYGPGDDYNIDNSHVLSALIKKIVDAKMNNIDTVEIWGSGKQRREFLYIDDMVDAMIWSVNNIKNETTFFNIGTGIDMSIHDLANKIAELVNYTGKFYFNTEKPDGMILKCLDISKVTALGWRHKVDIENGLKKSISDYIERSSK